MFFVRLLPPSWETITPFPTHRISMQAALQSQRSNWVRGKAGTFSSPWSWPATSFGVADINQDSRIRWEQFCWCGFPSLEVPLALFPGADVGMAERWVGHRRSRQKPQLNFVTKSNFFFLEKWKQKDKRQSEIIMANSLLNIQANSDNVIARTILKQFLSNLSHLLLHNLITVFPT